MNRRFARRGADELGPKPASVSCRLQDLPTNHGHSDQDRTQEDFGYVRDRYSAERDPAGSGK